MNSALFAQDWGATPYPGDGVTDFSNLNMTLLTQSGTANELVANASLTVPAVAVVLNGNPSNRQTDIGILGAIPPVRIVAHGVINQFALVIQDATGGIITDPGPGTARVVIGVALEASTASGQPIMVQTLAPQIRT